MSTIPAGMERFETLYLCNPSKAGACGKQGCYINDGSCFLTTNQDYAEEKDGEKIIAVSKETLEKASMKGLDLTKQIDKYIRRQIIKEATL